MAWAGTKVSEGHYTLSVVGEVTQIHKFWILIMNSATRTHLWCLGKKEIFSTISCCRSVTMEVVKFQVLYYQRDRGGAVKKSAVTSLVAIFNSSEAGDKRKVQL